MNSYRLVFDKITLTKKGWKCTLKLEGGFNGDAEIYTEILKPTIWEVYDKLKEYAREQTIVTKF